MPENPRTGNSATVSTKQNMPAELLYGTHVPDAHRFYDYPRPGSIYRLPDIKALVRGPTIVILPDGKTVKVAPSAPKKVGAPAMMHDQRESKGKLYDLLKQLEGTRARESAGKKSIDFERHPLRMPREAAPGRGHF